MADLLARTSVPSAPAKSRPPVTPAGSRDPVPAAAPLALVVLAYLTVYLAWGSTYFGIRVAVETLPPFLMAGARFFLAGVILVGLLWVSGKSRRWPTAAEWRAATIAGALLLLVGNGVVTWVELHGMASSLAALLVAVVPIWIVLLDWLRPGGVRPTATVGAGLLLGFGGVAILVWPHENPAAGAHPVDPFGVGLLMVACASWAAGSLLARHAKPAAAATATTTAPAATADLGPECEASAPIGAVPPRATVPDSPLLPVGLQMVCGGALLMLAGVAWGEPAHYHFADFSARSLWAFLYLLTFGSLLGFSAYSWLLQVSTPARVSTYAYVNPVIAVILGRFLGDEVLDSRILLGAAVIVASVALVIMAQARSGPGGSADSADSAGSAGKPKARGQPE